MIEPSSKGSESARPFLLAWTIYSGIVGLILLVRLVAFPGLNEWMDFRQLYTGGYLIRTDPANLYNLEVQKAIQDRLIRSGKGFLPYNHPPYEALLFAPLSHLPYTRAYLAFIALNLVLLLLCFFVARPAFSRHGSIAQPWPGLQFFAFLPVIMAVLQGQNAILFFLGACFVYRSLHSSRYATAGVILAALLFKPQVAVPLGVFLAVRFGASFLSGFVSAGLLVGAVSAFSAGWNTLLGFTRVLVQTGSAYVAPDAPYGVLGVVPLAMPNLRGLLFFLGAKAMSGRTLILVTIAMSLVIAFVVVYLLRRQNLDTERSFSLALTAAILLSYHLNLQDLTVLLLPFGLVAGEMNRNISRAIWLFYLAPPILFITSINTLFLLTLPLIVFLLGMLRASEEPFAAVSRA